MRKWIARRITRVVLAATVVGLIGAGIAYATIPDGGGVYTGCLLKATGTIRLIDPSLGSSNLLGHCTQLETTITWNQQGPAGPAGPAGQQGPTGPMGPPGQDGAQGPVGPAGKDGAPGANGTNGVSPTVAQLAAGDPHCANGGAAITGADGNTAYVCNGTNGTNGKDGQSFDGTFTSPNGEYSISVADDGINLKDSSGGTINMAGGNISLNDAQGNVALNAAQGNVAVKAPIGDISVTAPVGTVSVNGGTAKLSGQLSATIQAGANLDLKGGALAQVNAPLVQLGGACVPVALLGGLVSTPPMGGVGTIASGSNAVCAAP